MISKKWKSSGLNNHLLSSLFFCSRPATSILYPILRPQSGCGMREPEARSCNTTAGRVGAARRRRERLVAAGVARVCVGREPKAQAMSKPEGLAILRSSKCIHSPLPDSVLASHKAQRQLHPPSLCLYNPANTDIPSRPCLAELRHRLFFWLRSEHAFGIFLPRFIQHQLRLCLFCSQFVHKNQDSYKPCI